MPNAKWYVVNARACQNSFFTALPTEACFLKEINISADFASLRVTNADLWRRRQRIVSAHDDRLQRGVIEYELALVQHDPLLAADQPKLVEHLEDGVRDEDSREAADRSESEISITRTSAMD